MNGVRGRIEASRVGQTTCLDQPSSAGTSAALPGSGGDMNVMDPGRQKPRSSFAAELVHAEVCQNISLLDYDRIIYTIR